MQLIHKYASLLANYCLEIRPGDRVFVSTTTLAEPLVSAFYQAALQAGAALVEIDMAFRERCSC
jgi:aminopeptidase